MQPRPRCWHVNVNTTDATTVHVKYREGTGKKTPGGSGTKRHRGVPGHTYGTHGDTDLEPHNQPDPLTHTHDHATTPETTEPCSRL